MKYESLHGAKRTLTGSAENPIIGFMTDIMRAGG